MKYSNQCFCSTSATSTSTEGPQFTAFALSAVEKQRLAVSALYIYALFYFHLSIIYV